MNGPGRSNITIPSKTSGSWHGPHLWCDRPATYGTRRAGHPLSRLRSYCGGSLACSVWLDTHSSGVSFACAKVSDPYLVLNGRQLFRGQGQDLIWPWEVRWIRLGEAVPNRHRRQRAATRARDTVDTPVARPVAKRDVITRRFLSVGSGARSDSSGRMLAGAGFMWPRKVGGCVGPNRRPASSRRKGRSVYSSAAFWRSTAGAQASPATTRPAAWPWA